MIKAIFYIEAQGNNREVVIKSLENLVEKLKEEKGVIIEKEFFDRVIENEGLYSSVVELTLSFVDLVTYLKTAIKYGPSAIEILEPEKIEISAKDFLLSIGEIIAISRKFFSKYRITFTYPRKQEEISIGLEEEEIEDLLDEGAIRAKVIVESRGLSKEDFLNIFSDYALINKVKTKDGLIGVDAIIEEPNALLEIAVRFTPVLIEILEPEEIKLTTLDLQDMGVDLAGIFFEASQRIALSS